MGLSSAWKKIKKTVKKSTGINSWSDAVKSFTSPESFLTGGGWATWEATPDAVQGLSSLVGYGGNDSVDSPVAAEPLDYLMSSAYSTTGESGQNAENLRRRAGRSFATGGGALGSGSIATSGIRNILG